MVMKIFVPLTLTAVIAIAMVFAFAPSDFAQTTHVSTPTAGAETNVSISRAITGATIVNGGTIEELTNLVLPVFTGPHNVLIIVTASVSAGATATNYEISTPAIANVDCGSTAATADIQRIFTEADTLQAVEVNVTTQFWCTGTGLTSGLAFPIGHNSLVAVIVADDILVTATAIPT